MFLATASYCLFLRDCVWAHIMDNMDTIVLFQIPWSTNEAECIEHRSQEQGSCITHLDNCITQQGLAQSRCLRKYLWNWIGLIHLINSHHPEQDSPMLGDTKLIFTPWKRYFCLSVILTSLTVRRCMAPSHRPYLQVQPSVAGKICLPRQLIPVGPGPS